MSTVTEILNTIRDNASSDYTNLIPEATRENITAVGNAITSYDKMANEFLDMLVNRIAMTIVDNKIFENPLQILKKGTIPFGTDIQEIAYNVAKAKPYDESGQDLLKVVKPDIAQQFHRLNREDTFVVSINEDMLKHAFINEGTFTEFLSGIINTLYSGDNLCEFTLCKNLMGSAITDGKVKSGTLTQEWGSKDASMEFVKLARNVSSQMKYAGSNFNTYAEQVKAKNPSATVNPFITWTPLDRQILILRNDVATNIDLDVLAVSFNLDKSTLLTKTLEVDNFGSASDTLGFICDEAWFKIYDTKRKLGSFHNPENDTWKYIWHHHQVYSGSLLANAFAIKEKAGA